MFAQGSETQLLGSTALPGAGRQSLGDLAKSPIQPEEYTMSMSNFVSTAEKMKSVKAAWDKAPAGPKKDTALRHYQAAEKAQAAKQGAECLRELDAATHALAQAFGHPPRQACRGEVSAAKGLPDRDRLCRRRPVP